MSFHHSTASPANGTLHSVAPADSSDDNNNLGNATSEVAPSTPFPLTTASKDPLLSSAAVDDDEDDDDDDDDGSQTRDQDETDERDDDGKF